jgi:hypothetical protein
MDFMDPGLDLCADTVVLISASGGSVCGVRRRLPSAADDLGVKRRPGPPSAATSG